MSKKRKALKIKKHFPALHRQGVTAAMVGGATTEKQARLMAQLMSEEIARIDNENVDLPFVQAEVVFREDAPREFLEKMRGHKGKCLHCNGIVKMPRDGKTLVLLPDKCWCLMCGQQYFMLIDDITAWEAEQWQQKAEDNE